MKKIYITTIVILVISVALLVFSVVNNKQGSEISRLDYGSESENQDINEQSTQQDETQEVNQIESEKEVINNNTNNNTMDENTNVENNESGLKIEVVQEGQGQEAKSGDTVTVHYTGKFEDGAVFDSSVERGVPFDFQLGVGMVIKGWDRGVQGMKVGEKRILTIPSDLGYGPDGYGPIPGGATLVFDVELIAIK